MYFANDKTQRALVRYEFTLNCNAINLFVNDSIKINISTNIKKNCVPFC